MALSQCWTQYQPAPGNGSLPELLPLDELLSELLLPLDEQQHCAMSLPALASRVGMAPATMRQSVTMVFYGQSPVSKSWTAVGVAIRVRMPRT